MQKKSSVSFPARGTTLPAPYSGSSLEELKGTERGVKNSHIIVSEVLLNK